MAQGLEVLDRGVLHDCQWNHRRSGTPVLFPPDLIKLSILPVLLHAPQAGQPAINLFHRPCSKRASKPHTFSKTENWMYP